MSNYEISSKKIRVRFVKQRERFGFTQKFGESSFLDNESLKRILRITSSMIVFAFNRIAENSDSNLPVNIYLEGVINSGIEVPIHNIHIVRYIMHKLGERSKEIDKEIKQYGSSTLLFDMVMRLIPEKRDIHFSIGNISLIKDTQTEGVC